MERENIYLSLHCHHHNDSCIKMGSDESHFNVSVGSDGQSHKTVSTNHNLRKKGVNMYGVTIGQQWCCWKPAIGQPWCCCLKKRKKGESDCSKRALENEITGDETTTNKTVR